ncbi:helix-turn-helix domain-containing protein [Nonomuraea sp. KM90]|uniref:helix-turn-helix domain-containing protein n=1 Tax=Nonomuraea sp. KM90 TaxID=3457428 RepID=UPI003FCD374E
MLPGDDCAWAGRGIYRGMPKGDRVIGEINPTLRRRKIATELRRLREEAGLNGVQVSRSLHWSTSKLSRLETGQVAPSAEDVAKLLDHYRIGPEPAALLLSLAGNHAAKGWWESYSDVLTEIGREFVGLEDGASSLRTWGSNAVPGLLQTDAYCAEMTRLTRAVEIVPPGKVERRTRTWLRRQRRLFADPPLAYSAVIDEAVLRRRFGAADDGLMREQLRHLLKLGDRPNISIHVLLLEQSHPINFSHFVLLGFPSMPVLGPVSGDIVYSEDYPVAEVVEDEERVYRYSVIFDLLKEAALDEEASRDCIASLAGL